MNNWLVWIVLVITVAGTFVPCCAVDNCCADQVAGATGHNEHNDEGTCSPFFSCATCPGSVEPAKSIQLEFPAAQQSLIHCGETIRFTLPSYSPSFWQPPRSC